MGAPPVPTDRRTIAVDHADRVAWITLDRPDRLNTINDQMVTEIGETLDQVERDGETRVVVVTGRGRAFCAGADLAADADAFDRIPAFVERTQELLLRLRALPLPVIAAVNGLAMGGGLELALSADVVVAAAGAPIGDGHANVGVLPGAGGATVLPRRIGPGLAKYLLFTGDTVPAEDLHHAGLVARLFPPEQLLAGTGEIAARIAEKSPLQLRAVKRLVAEGLSADSEAAALRLELAAVREHVRSHDMAEGVSAFLDKRPPAYLGR